MAGNITKLDDRRWRVRIHLGYDENGKRQDFTKVIHGLKKDADKFLRDALRRKDMGETLDPDETTLGAFLDQWLAVKKTVLRRSTFDTYSTVVNLHLRPNLGKLQVRRITTPDIQAAYAKIAKHVSKTAKGTARPMGARGLRNIHRVLHSCLEYAVEVRIMAYNPCTYARPPKVPRVEREHFTSETGRKFVDTAKQHPQGLVYILAITTGMRPQEYLALQWRDLDWDTRRLAVRRTLCRHLGGGWALEETKTAKSRRTVVIPPELADMLREHKAKQDVEKALAGSQWLDHGFIFTGELGKPMNRKFGARTSFREIMRAAGLPETLRPYDLRHGCATVLLEQGDDLKSIADQLGHSGIQVTADVYAHVTRGMKESTATRIGQALLAPPAPPPAPPATPAED